MADRNTTKTALAQGKFIRSYDRPQLEARARALRAEAVLDIAQATVAAARGWFARHLGAARAST